MFGRGSVALLELVCKLKPVNMPSNRLLDLQFVNVFIIFFRSELKDSICCLIFGGRIGS